MKKILVLVAMVALATVVAPAQPSYGDASFGVFYSGLDQYGEWIALDGGVYAWRPLNVEADWRPYSYGHWVWTDYGWYWMSDEPWAWAVYHYGRWYSDDYYGWVWIPGYDWAPAWVEWRYGAECVGWAPLGPYAVFSPSFGIFYQTTWVTPYSYWCFTDYYAMTSPNLHQNIYRSAYNTRYIGQTRGGGSVQYEGGRIITRGPDRQAVERRSGTRVVKADIVDSDQRRPERMYRNGSEERLEIYRPSLNRAEGSDGGRPARVRESGRTMNLDVNKLDVRSRTLERDASESRSQQYRNDDQIRRIPAERLRPAEPQQRREYRPDTEYRSYERLRPAPRPEPQYNRTPAQRRENVDRPREIRPVERPPARREVERAPAPAPRQEAPHNNGRKRD